MTYDDVMCSGPPDSPEWTVTFTVRVQLAACDATEALIAATAAVEHVLDESLPFDADVTATATEPA